MNRKKKEEKRVRKDKKSFLFPPQNTTISLDPTLSKMKKEQPNYDLSILPFLIPFYFRKSTRIFIIKSLYFFEKIYQIPKKNK